MGRSLAFHRASQRLARPPGGPVFLGDWKGDFASPAASRPVAEMLDAYADWPGGDDAPEHLSVRVVEGRCAVRGLVDEESFQGMAPDLGALFRSAHAVGGRGDVTFAADTGDFAYRLALDGPASRFFKLRAEEELLRPSDVAAQEQLDALLRDRVRRTARSLILIGAPAGGAIRNGKSHGESGWTRSPWLLVVIRRRWPPRMRDGRLGKSNRENPRMPV